MSSLFQQSPPRSGYRILLPAQLNIPKSDSPSSPPAAFGAPPLPRPHPQPHPSTGLSARAALACAHPPLALGRPQAHAEAATMGAALLAGKTMCNLCCMAATMPLDAATHADLVGFDK